MIRTLFTSTVHPADVAALAERFPCRPIPPLPAPTYLSRYTLATFPIPARPTRSTASRTPPPKKRAHLFLHFFHRSDGDKELHSHPWPGVSLILTGGYREERRAGSPGSYRIEENVYRPGSVNLLRTDTFHRVELLDEAAGCWTLFLAGPRSESWGFWDRASGVFTPYEEFQARGAAGRAG